MALRKIRRLLGQETAIMFGVTAFSVGLAIYIGEKVIAANPELLPVKAQLRSFVNAGGEEFHPVPDPEIGFLGPPHLRTRVSTDDYESPEETDDHGFPNRLPMPQTAEIVVVGDSLIAGPGVGIDRAFSTLVGHWLSNTRIVNLGLGGEAPNRQLIAFRKFGASLRPKLVISCIYLASDLDNEEQFDSWLKEGATGDYNRYRLEFSDRQHPKSFWGRVQRRSYVAAKLTELALDWWGIKQRISFASGPDTLLDIDNLRLLALGLDRQDRRLLSMIESLKEMRALAQDGGANFLVLLIPSKEEIYGAPFMPEVIEPAQMLEQRLREEGFSVLSAYEAVRERAKDQPAYFPHDIHLNAFGNQIVADSLANWIEQTGVLSTDKAWRKRASLDLTLCPVRSRNA